MNMVFNLHFGEDARTYWISEKTSDSFIMKDEFNQYAVELLELSKNMVRIGINEEDYEIYLAKDQQSEIDIWYEGNVFHLKDEGVLDMQDFYESSHDSASGDILKSPMPGKVIKVLSEVGAEVKKGDVLLIVEAMKMENNLLAPRDGIVEEINVKEGEMVDGSKVLLSLVELEGE